MLNRKIITSMLTIVMAFAVMTGGTMAYFTAKATSDSNSFTSGDLKLTLAQGDAFVPFNVTGMSPGDSDATCGGVTNAGSLNFNWEFSVLQVTPTPTVNLNDVLHTKVDMWNGSSAPTQADCTVSATDNWIAAVPDTALNAVTNPVKVGELDSGNTAYYRITVSLPTNVTDTYQDGSSAYTVQVNAFQLGNTAY